MFEDLFGGKNRLPMGLSARIFMAFLIMILVPIILIMISFTVLLNVKTRSLSTQYGIESSSFSTLFNNSMMLASATDGDFDNLRNTALKHPENLTSMNYLNDYNAALAERQASLVVRVDGSIIYNGTERISDNIMRQILPKADVTDSFGWTRTNSVESILVKQIAFTDGDKDGSVFLVSDLTQLYAGYSHWIYEMGYVFILIMVGTSFIMSLWIYRGVISPISKLTRATKNIRDGNLDFSISGNGISEIDELIHSFENMRKQLQEAQESRMIFDAESKELITNISHDLKTPITAVKGYVEGIMDGVADTPEKMERYIRTIYNKANEMDKLINELTLYSKIDTNRIPYNFARVNAHEYFTDCASELELELEPENITFSFVDGVDESTEIIADAEQLTRVIHNIVNNSVKYMDKTYRFIEMRVLDADDFIQVEIEDNGRGIPAKDRVKIFDRFYRTDASRNSTRGGSGIGLSIVKKILEDHGGKIWAGGTEGEGTVMTFVLRKYNAGTGTQMNISQ